jgi:hypothetical protein
MFTIYIVIGKQISGVDILPSHTAQQILDYLRQDRLIPQFQANFHLQFNGIILPHNEPVAQYGIGPNAKLNLVAQSRPGFGGSGKETLLNTLLKAFLKPKQP